MSKSNDTKSNFITTNLKLYSSVVRENPLEYSNYEFKNVYSCKDVDKNRLTDDYIIFKKPDNIETTNLSIKVFDIKTIEDYEECKQEMDFSALGLGPKHFQHDVHILKEKKSVNPGTNGIRTLFNIKEYDIYNYDTENVGFMQTMVNNYHDQIKEIDDNKEYNEKQKETEKENVKKNAYKEIECKICFLEITCTEDLVDYIKTENDNEKVFAKIETLIDKLIENKRIVMYINPNNICATLNKNGEYDLCIWHYSKNNIFLIPENNNNNFLFYLRLFMLIQILFKLASRNIKFDFGLIDSFLIKHNPMPDTPSLFDNINLFTNKNINKLQNKIINMIDYCYNIWSTTEIFQDDEKKNINLAQSVLDMADKECYNKIWKLILKGASRNKREIDSLIKKVSKKIAEEVYKSTNTKKMFAGKKTIQKKQKQKKQKTSKKTLKRK